MKIVCISDTHNRHRELDMPEGDILIHAGDFTHNGSKAEVQDFLNWLDNLEVKYGYILVVPGNHDKCLANKSQFNVDWFWEHAGATLLIDQSTNTRAIRRNTTLSIPDAGIFDAQVSIYGSPYTPLWGNGRTFMKSRDRLNKTWANIPGETDLLITHGPPKGILDTVANGQTVGCKSLYNHVLRVKPKLHVFGHVHDNYGGRPCRCLNNGVFEHEGIKFVNASVVRHGSKRINQPIVIEI